MKEKYKNFKDIFNFEYFEEMKKDNKQKKNTRKKKLFYQVQMMKI
jgi:hypothetical protein